MKTFNLSNTSQNEKHKHLCLLIYFSSNGRCWHACTDALKLSTCVQQRYMQLQWRLDAAAIFNLSLLLERFNDPFCWNFEVLFAFMQNYVLRTITYSLCISFWHLSSLSFSLSLFHSRSYIPILCYKKISCNVQSKPKKGATFLLQHNLGLIV